LSNTGQHQLDIDLLHRLIQRFLVDSESPLQIAERYFAASNEHDFVQIGDLLSASITYDSSNTATYRGRDDILAMQRQFHGSFLTLRWEVNSMEEIEPGNVVVNYTFVATKADGEAVTATGLERIVITDRRIQHIEIRDVP
jgi:hypothetical protein